MKNLVQQVEQLVQKWKEEGEDESPSQPIGNPQCSEECCAIQTPQYAESYDNMLETLKLKSQLHVTHAQRMKQHMLILKSTPDPLATQVHVPPKSFPQRLQEDMSLIVLGEVHTNSISNMSPDQLSNTLTDTDTGQVPPETVFVAELNTPAVKPIKFEENRGKSHKQAETYNEKKKILCGRQIPRREIWPVQKLWGLNTRFKSAYWRHKPHWKGSYLISPI
ncbi:hypothetical protein DVH24_040093 [Malus domestica]|uniref:Uncharacterized protein n=1 Tax=Malus domestica TaxID=3750 RepID=A0A498I7C4_MALDO|nr:hypothetical protein DVH24_040093 [Malus domestica]